MAQNTFPLGILKNIMLVFVAFGIAVYLLFWGLYMLPDGRFFDIGLFSFCIVFVGFGVVGYWVAHMEQKKQKEQELAQSQK